MTNNDVPKINIKDDDLKFGTYSSKLAHNILNYKDKETLILSIEGKWGSGKTSLINFIKSNIQKIDIDRKIKILHFNPWLITDLEQVINLFFKELMKIILSITTTAKKDEFIKDIKDFISYISPDDIKVGLNDGTKVKYNISKRLKNEKTLEEVKEKINKYLEKLDTKIIIIIDDIDRLTDKETEFIFRLTKGIADFNNLIYILLYDKDVVSKSLQKFKSENGESYLEKIVQYPITVPAPNRITIKNLLFKELNKILYNLDKEHTKYIFNKTLWYQLTKVINKYIKTIRDINQIINIISFEYKYIAEEVNFTDFFIISLIRLKNYKLYELIKNEPNKFFIYTNESIENEKAKKNIYEYFKNNLQEFNDYKDLLKIIFPFISNQYSGAQIDGHKTKSISDINYFENYFSFSTADDKISMKEYNQIKQVFLSSDYKKFEKIILEVDKNKKSEYFLEMFNQLEEELSDTDIENVFLNSLNVMKKINSKQNDFFQLNISAMYENLGFDLVKKHTNIDEFLLKIYQTNKTILLNTKMNLFIYLKDDLNKIINETTFNKLKDILKDELENIKFENMFNYREIPTLVYRYDLVNASLENLQNEVANNMFENNINFFKVLDLFKSTTITNGVHKSHSIYIDGLKQLVSIEKVEDYIRNINKSSIKQKEKKLLNYWDFKSSFVY